MRSLIELIGGTLILAVFCWIFIYPPHPNATHTSKTEELELFCKLDQEGDEQLLFILFEAREEEKIKLRLKLHELDLELNRLSFRFHEKWGQYPNGLCLWEYM